MTSHLHPRISTSIHNTMVWKVNTFNYGFYYIYIYIPVYFENVSCRRDWSWLWLSSIWIWTWEVRKGSSSRWIVQCFSAFFCMRLKLWAETVSSITKKRVTNGLFVCFFACLFSSGWSQQVRSIKYDFANVQTRTQKGTPELLGQCSTCHLWLPRIERSSWIKTK